MAFHPSTCPFCSCGCALLLHEEGGRLLGSYPRTIAAGRASLCIRGWNCTSTQSHPDRLTTPMVRGAQGLVPVSPEEAIREVARRLRKADSPPLFAIGPSIANEDAFAVRRLARALGSRLCTTDLSGALTARLALRHVLGRGYGMRDLETIAGADVIWAFGVDPAECPQVASRMVHARRAGAVIVRFDVYAGTEGDGARSVTLPPHRLGDVAASLQKAVFQAGLGTKDARSATGYEALAESWGLRAADGLPVLPDDEALALARGFSAASRPVAIIGSRWLTSARAEDDTSRLLEALALIAAADRILTAVGEVNSWGCLDVLGSEVELAELACRADDLDTLVVAGDDLVRRSPRPDELAATLERLRSVVVIDAFTNDTLPFADVVLPSSTFAERDGTVTNVFGSVQRWNQAVPPPGDCRPERAWAARIGRELDVAGWPASPPSWFEALQNQVDGYRGLSPGLLYGGQGRASAELAQSGTLQVEARTQLAFGHTAGAPEPLAAAEDAAFPMRLVLGTQPAEFSTGAVTHREELLAREARESILFASPEALEQVGVKPGWPVKVTVPGGQATVTVRGDVRLPPDVVVLMPLAGSPSVRLRGSYPGAGRRTLGLQPVPARLERA